MRDVSAAPEKEEEEAEGPLRAQDLRESYIQLVQGVQEWQDGCMYQGEFGLNMKLGYGKFSWPTGESYHGQFYRDHCHGLGTYMWPDGSSFTGTFYLSHREGYGTMYMKTRLFQTHCHNDIVNLLLDCGADVNKCSDEGLTALSMCFLLHYPAQSFKPNVAERTIPEPQEPPKFPVVPILSSSFMDTNLESLYYEVNVPSQGSYELRPPPAPLLLPRVSGSHEGGHFQDTGQCGGSIDHRSSSLKGDSPLVKGSLGHVESGLEDVLGNTDRGSLCSAETKFESNVCVCDFSIELSQAMLERSAQSHSLLKMASPSPCTSSFDKGTMRRMALSMIERRKRWRTIKLLLRRGADPNLCCVPMQVLFLAVKAGDVDGVRLLLEHGARTDICFPPQLSTLTPLHIAAALPGEEGVQIVELLLHAITDVDAKASDEDDTYKPGKVVKELLTQGADPNLPLTKGLGSALCVACDLTYEHQRNMDSKLALIDRLISHGADILKPVMLRQGEKEAVGTAVDYGYFRFFQDRRIARCPFHTLMPAERETFLARKRLLEYMGLQLRQAVFAKESQWDPTWLYLCKRAELIPSHRMKKKGPSLPRGLDVKEQGQIPFFKFCYQCGRSIGVRLLPCPRCYGILTCSKYCKTKAWTEFHKKDCGDLVAIGSKRACGSLEAAGQGGAWKPEILPAGPNALSTTTAADECLAAHLSPRGPAEPPGCIPWPATERTPPHPHFPGEEPGLWDLRRGLQVRTVATRDLAAADALWEACVQPFVLPGAGTY
ncbi:ankyrin repeat and MYND domain-containing protein 1 isoform 12 [Homo sapiens]|nr:ankyrin repeat and MYND domain-containing protein 1 isoform 12 [Homo sapiens]